jgi:hypothetical protein
VNKRGNGWRKLKEDFGGVWGLVKSSEMHSYDYMYHHILYIYKYMARSRGVA